MYIQKSAHIYASPQQKSWQFGPLKQKVLGTYENRKGTEMRHDGVCSVCTTTLWRERENPREWNLCQSFLNFRSCSHTADRGPTISQISRCPGLEAFTAFTQDKQSADFTVPGTRSKPSLAIVHSVQHTNKAADFTVPGTGSLLLYGYIMD